MYQAHGAAHGSVELRPDVVAIPDEPPTASASDMRLSSSRLLLARFQARKPSTSGGWISFPTPLSSSRTTSECRVSSDCFRVKSTTLPFPTADPVWPTSWAEVVQL